MNMASLIWLTVNFCLENPALPRYNLSFPALRGILKSQNQAKNIPVVLPSSPIQIWGKSVQGFMSYDQTYTNKQKNKDYNFIYKSSSDFAGISVNIGEFAKC